MLETVLLLFLFIGQTSAQSRPRTLKELNKYHEDLLGQPFTGRLFFCPEELRVNANNTNNSKFIQEFEIHHYGKPSPYVTTRSIGKDESGLVDPYRQSALYHEYVLVGPGHAQANPNSRDLDDEESSNEEILLYVYDEEGLHEWEVKPIIEQHKLAMEHVWALINATGALPSMTVSNTTFKRTFRFHADQNDSTAYHLSYPQLFQSREPIPPMDVLVEFPANTRTMRTLKTVINYQTFSLFRWRLSPAPLVKDPRFTTLAMRAETVTFHNYCNEYVNAFIEHGYTYQGFSRFMKCIFQRRLKRVDNPCMKDMFLTYVILNYARKHINSTPNLMISVPMVHDVAQEDSKGWMNMTDVYCPGDLDPEECGEPLDVVLTNDHLLILTDRGIWVSASLNATNANTSMPYILKPLLKFSPIDPCAYLSNFNCSEVGSPILGHQSVRRHRLFYTPVCHLYQYPFYDDIVIYVVDHVTQTTDLSEERDAFTVLYASKPYAEWKILFHALCEYNTSDGALPIKELISIFYNHHRRQFDISLLLDGNGKDRTFRFVLPEPLRDSKEAMEGYGNLSGLLGEGFLEFEFPSTFYMTHLEVNPETMDVFYLGNAVWVAESAGAFLYLSVPIVKDHVEKLSRVETCSFNHPDRTFVCTELTHAEIYVGRVGVSYSPVDIEYQKIVDFKYTSLYRYWPITYISYIGLTGNFIASYAGKVLLWFSPDYLVLHNFLRHIKQQQQQPGQCEQNPAGGEDEEESPVRCLVCKKLENLIRKGCDVLNLNDFIEQQDPALPVKVNVEFPFDFEMVAFDPAHFKTRDTHTHGPLVPFPIDGDKVVVFEAEIPTLRHYKPERHYLNDINVGNLIICRPSKTPQEQNVSNPNTTQCYERRDSDVTPDCELYIRHMKNLKREGEFGFLEGFRRAFYATVVTSFPVEPIPTDVVVVILQDSNIALVQLSNCNNKNPHAATS